MWRVLACTMLPLVLAGCTQRYTYVIDVSSVEGFAWDGKIEVTKIRDSRLGPFLQTEESYPTESVTLRGRDGRQIVIDVEGYRHTPIATVELASGMPREILSTGVRIASGYFEDGLPSRDDRIRLQPDLENAQDLTLDDWLDHAAASSVNTLLVLTLRDPDLVLTVCGDEREAGPVVYEVITRDGRVLRRFERERIPVEQAGEAAEAAEN